MTWRLGEQVEVRYLDLWARAEIAGFLDPIPQVKVRILDERKRYRGLTGGCIPVPYSLIRRPKQKRVAKPKRVEVDLPPWHNACRLPAVPFAEQAAALFDSAYGCSTTLEPENKRDRAVFAHQPGPSSAPNKEART